MRLYRSRRNRMISGLIGGLSEQLGFSSFVMRVLALISIPFTGGTTIFIYFIAALVISKEPYIPHDPHYNGGWNNGGYNNNTYGSGNPGGHYEDPRFRQRPPGGNPFGGNPFESQSKYGGRPAGNGFESTDASNLDSMMQDIEKKAMKKELEELRKKLTNYEKGEM